MVVGVNRFQDADEKPIEILHIDQALEAKQIERVQRLRARRDGAAVERTLTRLKEDAARDDRNLMPAMVGGLARVRDDGRDVRRAPSGLGTWRETPVF